MIQVKCPFCSWEWSFNDRDISEGEKYSISCPKCTRKLIRKKIKATSEKISMQEHILEIQQLSGSNRQEQKITEFLQEFLKAGKYFVVSPWTEDLDQVRPFIGMHLKRVPCYYVFTDSRIAQGFSRHYGLNSPNGEILFMKLKTENFLKQLEAYRTMGVQLVMFDEGASFFCDSIERILKLAVVEN